MAYFDTVHNPSTFQQKALLEGAKNLTSLLDTQKPTPASFWGPEHLLALRVLCRPLDREGNLPLLEPYLPKDLASVDPRIQALIRGPDQDIQALARMAEPQICHLYDPESLGLVWVALSKFFRSPPVNQPRVNHPGVDQDSYAQYYLTLGLIEIFMRLVLAVGQNLKDQKPDVSPLKWREARSPASHQLPAGSNRIITAIDDGGVRLFCWDGARTVALLEAKPCFQFIENGKPGIPDEPLAHMTGQALLALLGATQESLVVGTSVITIPATSHYVRFFSFEPSSPEYLTQLEHLSPTDDSGPYLWVSSSDWFDISEKEGREMVVRHVLALVTWAHENMRKEAAEESD
ncbi:hypothetical protein F5144DRAFT_637876 [Chaetomium tenue]|uniref:Uncharacterized protein n=1 Tax=Chaetomium tenue TaxID=1854479 RepID=A0ACB7PSA4_9PEZI|nr:hypothetical protein F5144DRAFT_637876 [Chaetomium globosum]